MAKGIICDLCGKSVKLNEYNTISFDVDPEKHACAVMKYEICNECLSSITSHIYSLKDLGE